MRILVDMNLSPDWISVFRRHGIESVHWSSIGNPKASDSEIIAWAFENSFVIFTYDLDFGTILACTRRLGPSVIQVRTRDVLPTAIGPLVLGAIQQFESQIQAGALLVIDERRLRARILPFT